MPLHSNLTIGDWATVVGVVLAIPPVVSAAIAALTPPVLEVVAPTYLQVRADLDSSFHPNCDPERRGGGPACAEPDIDAALQEPIFLIVPVTYTNTGDPGESILVERENLVVEDADGTVLATFLPLYDTRIVPIRSRNWWLGDISPWLIPIVPSRGARSQTVVFEPENPDCSICKYDGFRDHLEKEGKFSVRLQLTTFLDDAVAFSERCTVTWDAMSKAMGIADPRKASNGKALRDFFRPDMPCRSEGSDG